MKLRYWLLLPIKLPAAVIALILWIIIEMIHPDYEEPFERDMTE